MYPYALASLTEAAAFIQYVQTQREVGKEACFAGLSSAEKDDLVPDDIHSFLERQTAAFASPEDTEEHQD